MLGGFEDLAVVDICSLSEAIVKSFYYFLLIEDPVHAVYMFYHMLFVEVVLSTIIFQLLFSLASFFYKVPADLTKVLTMLSGWWKPDLG